MYFSSHNSVPDVNGIRSWDVRASATNALIGRLYVGPHGSGGFEPVNTDVIPFSLMERLLEKARVG